MTEGPVAVAMSGGVDSSVAAAVLLEQGVEVVGVTMCVVAPDAGAADPAPPAAEGARTLGIPHHVFDLREPFDRLIVEPFCDAYAAGRTPNPCVHCNRLIKFGELLRRVEELGMSRLATGHYARIRRQGDRWCLLAGVDKAKDQSYSLYALSQEQLARALFPLGEMTKEQVRGVARRLNLSARPESQEICFIGGRGYRDYLLRRRPGVARPGPIVDRRGRRIGTHRGIGFYTVGQRQGLGVAAGEPLYVLGIDVEGNRLIAGTAEEAVFSGLTMEQVNCVCGETIPPAGTRMTVKIRARAARVACLVSPEENGARVEFDEPQRGVSAGQAAVCYEGDAVVMGGIIETAA